MLVALLTSPGAHADDAMLTANRNNHAEAFAVDSAPTLSLADIERNGVSRSSTAALGSDMSIPPVATPRTSSSALTPTSLSSRNISKVAFVALGALGKVAVVELGSVAALGIARLPRPAPFSLTVDDEPEYHESPRFRRRRRPRLRLLTACFGADGFKCSVSSLLLFS